MHESLLGEGLLDEVFRLAKQKMINGTGFINGCQVGDFVSFYWDWACEVLPGSIIVTGL
jgi:hypothetical protein